MIYLEINLGDFNRTGSRVTYNCKQMMQTKLGKIFWKEKALTAESTDNPDILFEILG